MKLNYYILCSLLFFYSGFGQTLKDTIHLSEIEISPSLFTLKDKSFESGKKIEHTDTLLKKIFLLNALSDALNFQTSVFVKNYAPGGIGTASIRGGNASQTSVLWNGININHPMLGQSDFSQLSVSLFDNISVEYGASSSLWGSGAMNGSIRLENNFSLKEKFLFSYRRGSFNSNYWFGKFNSSIKNIKYYVSGNLQSSENNYSIGDSIQLKYAKFNMQDWNAGISYAFKNFHRISYHFWVHNGKNNQPNNYLNATYATLLTNQNIRNVVDYLFQEKSLKIGIKAAYLIDNLNYTDSVANINSKSKVHTVQTEENIYKPLTKNSQIVFGHQWVYNYAITNNYLNNSFINRHSVFIGYEHVIRKLAFNVIIRKEWANIAADIPFTGNVGVSYTIFRPFRLKAQLSKFYRLPTMNDLYWKGSGNQNLKPEDGYCYEGGIVIHYQWLFAEFYSELTAFNRITNNWIIWLPGGSNQPIPKNIAEVWSRGTETSNYLLMHFGKLKLKTSVSSSYILSTIEKSTVANDASIGRQLIYTPRYNINGSVQVIYQNAFFVFTHQYVGYRFVSSDNLQWLEPYHISNVSLGYEFKLKKFRIDALGSINNIFNTFYMVVSQRPMPGRNFFLQINIKIK